MKKILLILLIVTASLLTLCACDMSDPDLCSEHIDANTDGRCDNCSVKTGECSHEDAESDSVCDKCGEECHVNDLDGLKLISNSVPNFTFVVSSGVPSKVISELDDYIDTINKKLDKKVTRVSDSLDSVNECEILIGSPKTRGDEYKIDKHYLGYTGYTVKLIGTKILVLGGSDDSFEDAFKYLVDEIFKVTSKTKKIQNVTMIPEQSFEKVQSEDAIKLSIAGTPLSEFHISTSGDAISRDTSLEIQKIFYQFLGVWVKIDNYATDGKSISLQIRERDGDFVAQGGFNARVTEDGSLEFSCCYPDKFGKTVIEIVNEVLKSSRNGICNVSADFNSDVNLRDVYYSDFGAVGDGMKNDFAAIKECHDYANEWGHTVNADADATYYIGTGNGSNTISVRTDTYWHGCKFIFDDRSVLPSSDERTTPIFSIESETKTKSYSGASCPITSIMKDTTKVDWEPGERVMVILYNRNERHFIRYGVNENNGDSQRELIIVNADGTLDPSTPLQWDYETVTSMTVVYISRDTPITVSGSSPGNEDPEHRATIETLFNGAPSAYTYYKRNIEITRSNVFLTSVCHIITGDDTSETGAPYSGFTLVSSCDSVVIDNFIFERHKSFSTTGASGGDSSMGSYEMSASLGNNITWQNSTQSNFFEENGAVKYHGTMGTNYCKNLIFDNMFTCSFDAHCGTYNATIRNSTVEHLNFIGAGTITIENTTVYTDGANAGMIFRTDYGATWEGNIIIDGLTLKTSKNPSNLTLIKSEWTNHYFGYVTYLPETIEINDVKVLKIKYSVDNAGNRSEEVIDENHVQLNVYYQLNSYISHDISDPDETFNFVYQNDYKNCSCHTVYEGNDTLDHFNDTDGDGRCNNPRKAGDSVYCWGFDGNADRTLNANPYVPTKTVIVTNCGDLQIVLPPTEQFENTKLYIDGALQ